MRARLVFGSAVILELLQIVTPDRDARIIDAVEKLAGGAAGIVAGKVLLVLSRSQKALDCES